MNKTIDNFDQIKSMMDFEESDNLFMHLQILRRGKDPNKKPTGFQQTKYGVLRADWRDTLAKGFAECFRVLRPGGFLIFKWCEHDIKVSTILKLTDQKPIFGHKSGKRANTHWICFMKGGQQ